jgi:NAD(P)-dependent dehydrogenase (short-subunit alcohol dehydrogenase family)
MRLAFANQTVLITGAGSGVGRRLALELSRHGATIAALDLHSEPLATLIRQIESCQGDGAWAVGDVTNLGSLRTAVEAFTRRWGAIDILVANAGIAIETSALDFRVDDLEKQIRVNLLGVANSVAAVLPGMLSRGRGHLVAISSVASQRGFPYGAGYCASKAGVNALMDSLRAELRPHGIRCTTICPGWIRTPLAKQMTLRKRGMLEVDDAVRQMVRAIRKRKAFHTFPARSRLALALLARLPVPLADWASRRWVQPRRKQQESAQRRVA